MLLVKFSTNSLEVTYIFIVITKLPKILILRHKMYLIFLTKKFGFDPVLICNVWAWTAYFNKFHNFSNSLLYALKVYPSIVIIFHHSFSAKTLTHSMWIEPNILTEKVKFIRWIFSHQKILIPFGQSYSLFPVII